MNKIVILTGGIGVGKSSVAEIFTSIGVKVLDTDLISKNLTKKNSSCLNLIIDEFGKNFLNSDGTLDRLKMRKLIYENNSAKKKLENLLHPFINEKLKSETLKLNVPYLIQIIPLWFEINRNYRPVNVWKILVVDCPINLRRSRTIARSKIDSQTFDLILNQQSSRKDKLEIADVVINNNSDLNHLKKQIITIHKDFINSLKET